MNITTVPAVRIVVTGETLYSQASGAAYVHAVLALGSERLNLVDCTKRLADGAFLFTYNMIKDTDVRMAATHPRG